MNHRAQVIHNKWASCIDEDAILPPIDPVLSNSDHFEMELAHVLGDIADLKTRIKWEYRDHKRPLLTPPQTIMLARAKDVLEKLWKSRGGK